MEENCKHNKLTEKWFKLSHHRYDVKPVDTALFLWILYTASLNEWKDGFSLDSFFAMESLNIASRSTFFNSLFRLEEIGAINIIKKSKNQHTANIISITL
jgi:hypothetical protein